MSKANRLREILESRGTSQTWVAKQTGLKIGTINELVNEKRSPTLENARKIADVLGMTVDDIWPNKR